MITQCFVILRLLSPNNVQKLTTLAAESCFNIGDRKPSATAPKTAGYVFGGKGSTGEVMNHA